MNRRLRAYTYLLGFAFWSALVAALVVGPPSLETVKRAAPLVALALLGEELVVRQRHANSEGAISFSAVSHVAAAILLPPPIAAATAAAGIVIGDGIRGDGRRYLLIDWGMFGSAAWLSAMLFHTLRPAHGPGTSRRSRRSCCSSPPATRSRARSSPVVWRWRAAAAISRFSDRSAPRRSRRPPAREASARWRHSGSRRRR